MYHVLFGDEALDVAVREGLLERLGESGIFGVSVQGHHPLACLSQFSQCQTVCTPCCHLKYGTQKTFSMQLNTSSTSQQLSTLTILAVID